MKPTPHWHPGEVEACWNRFCVRVATSDVAAAAIGGGLLGGLVGGIVTRKAEGALAGAILGAMLGLVSTG